MLVLSRRPGQKVIFPGLGISVEVLRSRGSVTKLGIDAPANVVVLRDEVVNSDIRGEQMADTRTLSADRRLLHERKNRLNALVLKLELLQQQLDLGRATEPDLQLDGALSELRELEHATTDAGLPATSPKVLIVEDQDNERELLAGCLRLKGIDVSTAGNGREAFDVLHEDALPDLILLDLRMPDVDGPTFLKSVRDNIRLRNLRIFAVTGSSRDEFNPDLLPLDGWISKPVRIDALLEAVRAETRTSVVSA